jgi:phosphoribosylanthranilate isomerase
MRTRVKICGITRAEDALAATALGANYLGFVFVRDSPRYIDPVAVRSIAIELNEAAAPPHSRVGVFRNPSRDEILRAIDIAQLDVIQLHGNFVDVNFPTIHAFQVQGSLPNAKTQADYVLFDTGGGTGRTFDWSLLASYPRTKPFFLAGGITPENVAEAIAKAKPYAVDLATGVETSPGVKDRDKLKALFEAIQP